MAELIDTPKEWLEKEGETFREFLDRTGAMLKELRKNQPETGYVGCLIQFPVADGYAIYKVESEKPLQLSHIPYGDAYRIPNPYIKGLELSDIKAQVDLNRTLYSKKK
jgi:hypothetical protein